MSWFYNAAYAVGFTPWETAARKDGDRIVSLIEREESERGGTGKALDLGCGSGMHLVMLAERGWSVTGVDLVDKALARARKRVAAKGLTAAVIRADVTELPADLVGTDYDLFLDFGCFHGLKPDERLATARAVTARAAQHATMLMFAITKPIGPRFMPQGATRENVEATFGDWDVVDVITPSADLPGLPKFVRKAEPVVYRLRRRH